MADQDEGAAKGQVATRIENILTAALSPISLKVIDESRHHAGHGHPGDRRHGHESHFRVEVVSAAFEGKSRVDRHRMVNALLAEELRQGLHALAVTARAPGEPL